jgi:phosphoribosylglycinamide formyltransferase-1
MPTPDDHSDTQLPIAVLVSGTGTNLQALLERVHGRDAQIVAVASSVSDAPALQRAVDHGVPRAVFSRSDYAHRRMRDEAMADWLSGHGAQLIVLAGFMELVTEAFLERFPESVINIHPSLLPDFPGLNAIEQALAHGRETFGVTVHYVDAGMDTGAVIEQRSIELPGAADPGKVLEAIRPLEHELLASVVQNLASRRRLVPA